MEFLPAGQLHAVELAYFPAQPVNEIVAARVIVVDAVETFIGERVNNGAILRLQAALLRGPTCSSLSIPSGTRM